MIKDIINVTYQIDNQIKDKLINMFKLRSYTYSLSIEEIIYDIFNNFINKIDIILTKLELYYEELMINENRDVICLREIDHVSTYINDIKNIIEHINIFKKSIIANIPSRLFDNVYSLVEDYYVQCNEDLSQYVDQLFNSEELITEMNYIQNFDCLFKPINNMVDNDDNDDNDNNDINNDINNEKILLEFYICSWYMFDAKNTPLVKLRLYGINNYLVESPSTSSELPSITSETSITSDPNHIIKLSSLTKLYRYIQRSQNHSIRIYSQQYWISNLSGIFRWYIDQYENDYVIAQYIYKNKNSDIEKQYINASSLIEYLDQTTIKELILVDVGEEIDKNDKIITIKNWNINITSVRVRDYNYKLDRNVVLRYSRILSICKI